MYTACILHLGVHALTHQKRYKFQIDRFSPIVLYIRTNSFKLHSKQSYQKQQYPNTHPRHPSPSPTSSSPNSPPTTTNLALHFQILPNLLNLQNIPSLNSHPNLLMPRLLSKNIMHSTNLLIPPNRTMDIPPPQRLQRIKRIRNSHPSSSKDIREKLLVREIVFLDPACLFECPRDSVVDLG